MHCCTISLPVDQHWQHMSLLQLKGKVARQWKSWQAGCYMREWKYCSISDCYDNDKYNTSHYASYNMCTKGVGQWEKAECVESKGTLYPVHIYCHSPVTWSLLPAAKIISTLSNDISHFSCIYFHFICLLYLFKFIRARSPLSPLSGTSAWTHWLRAEAAGKRSRTPGDPPPPPPPVTPLAREVKNKLLKATGFIVNGDI